MKARFTKIIAVALSISAVFSSFSYADSLPQEENSEVPLTTETQIQQEVNQPTTGNVDVPPTNNQLETVNNYFIGTFRLYDEVTGKTYDFKASKAFTYDYKQPNPPLVVDDWSFNVFTKEIENFFSQGSKSVYYPKQLPNSSKFSIEKASIGKKVIDKVKFKEELFRRIKTADYSIMKIPFTNESINEAKILQSEVVLLAKYSTQYDASNWGRSQNIIMTGKEFNGTKLKPKEAFYFNSRFKPLSGKFKVAKIILDDEFVDGVGGGLCQVSTTLFNAALESGLQIDYRRPHSLPISYVPRGRDAMVSDYSDFVFSNNFPNDVYIMYSEEGSGNITFSIYGKKSDLKTPKIWVEGSGLRFTLYRQIGSKTDKFSSVYSVPKAFR